MVDAMVVGTSVVSPGAAVVAAAVVAAVVAAAVVPVISSNIVEIWVMRVSTWVISVFTEL